MKIREQPEYCDKINKRIYMSKVSIKEIPDGPLRLSIDTNEDTIEDILFDANGKTIPIKKTVLFVDVESQKLSLFVMEFIECVVLNHLIL